MVALRVPPAVLPVKAMSPEAKPVTLSLNWTRKLMGAVLVGSVWVTAWLTVTVGATLSKVTVLSVLVEARLGWVVATDVQTPALMAAITVPGPVMPVTATL